MEWIRRISLVKRVVFGFTGMGVALACTGTAAVWALKIGRAHV